MRHRKRRQVLLQIAGCCVFAAAAKAQTNITSQVTANDSVALSGGSYSITTTSGSPITYSGVLSGTGTVELTGNGNLILENISTYTLPTVTETITEIQINGNDKQFASYEGYTTQFSPALSNGDDGGFNGPIYTLHYGTSGQPDAAAITINAGVDLQFGSNTDLHEGDGEVGAGNISNPTTSNMNLDNVLDNGTLTFQGNNASFSDTQYIGQISGTGPVVVQTGILGLYNANSFSGPLLIENNMTLILGSDHITAAIPDASAVFNNGTLILDTPYNTPAAQPMTITQNIYENHFGNDINVNGFGGLVVLAGVYTYTDNSNNTNDPAGQMNPSLSNANDNFNNELNVIDNRRGINLGISSGTGSTNPAGGVLQLGNGTSTNFFLPGNPLTTYISLEQNSILALDYSNSGPTYVNTIIAGGPTGTSDTQESLATPGTGVVVFHQGDIVVTQQQYYDGITQIDSGATVQLGDGTTGDTQKTGSGEISFQTSGGDGDLLQSGQTVSVTDTTGESGHSSTSTGTSACQLIDNGSLIIDNVNATYFTAVSGSGKLTQAGAGTTSLGASITYTGATAVSGGTLALESGASLADSSSITISSTGRSVAAPYSSSNTNFAPVGPPKLDISQAGNQTFQSLAGDNTGSLYLGGNTLTVGSSASTSYGGKILDGGIGGGSGGALIKLGNGSLTLSGSSTFTGGTTIDAGTLLISADDNLGAPTGPLTLSGGELAVTSGFTTARPIAISQTSTIDVASGNTLTTNPSALTWSGATLKTTDTGTVAIAQTGGTVTVTPGSALNVGSTSRVTIGGSVDPFTDSNTPANHVAITNNGSITVADVNSSIAGIAGTGALTVGDGSIANTLQLAPGSGGSSQSSITINSGSALDLSNNHLVINFGSNADPKPTILGYLSEGANGGAWNGTGIISSTAAATSNYGVGFADGADGIDPNLSSGQIEVAYAQYGDITLQGVVNATDFTILSQNFGHVVTGGWEDGDFLYQGTVNAADFSLLTANFGLTETGEAVSMPANDWAAIGSFATANDLTVASNVPEPMSIGLLILSGAGLLGRRRPRASRSSCPSSACAIKFSPTNASPRSEGL